MRHGISGRKFNRPTEQRLALFNSLARSLFKYEQIKTTLPKAKDLRPYVEKMLTVAKRGKLADRRRLFSRLRDDELVAKVCGPLAGRFAKRQGGYTRIVKCGFRQGDAAPMAIIELLDAEVAAPSAEAESAAVVEGKAEAASEKTEKAAKKGASKKKAVAAGEAESAEKNG